MLKKCKTRFTNEEGFTLLETVISIAALALVSGFIIQMFLVSSNVNARAKEMDSANAAAIMAVELYKKNGGENSYAREGFFSGCALRENENGFVMYKWYDADFTQVPIERGYAKDPGLPPGGAPFLLKIEVVKGEERRVALLPGEDMPPAGRLDTVRASVMKFGEEGAGEIVRVDADKYFAYSAG